MKVVLLKNKDYLLLYYTYNMASVATLAAIGTLSGMRFHGHPDIFKIKDPKESRYSEYRKYEHLNGKPAIELYFHGVDPFKAIKLTKELKKDSDKYQKLINDNKKLYSTIKKLNGGDDWQKEYTTEQDKKALIDIQNRLNSGLSTLSNEYNDRINILKTNEGTLDTAQQYISIQNAKLREQLKNIYLLENVIRTKQRLTEINTDHYKREIVVSNCLKMFIPTLFLIIIFVAFYLGGKISLGYMMIIIIFIVIFYGIYVWYKLNDIKKPAWKKNSLKKDFSKIGEDIYDEGRKLEKEFIDENCDCPNNNLDKTNNKPDQMNNNPDSNFGVNNSPPLLYNDGSTTTKVIYPLVKNKNLLMDSNTGMVQKIE